MKSRVHGLYVIADTGLVDAGSLARRVAGALKGGAAIVQYRNKQALTPALAADLQAIQRLCRTFDVPLIINDDVALARELGADGVHLGRDDTDIAEARRVLGGGRLIGASCYNLLPCAVAARDSGADYVAFGSFFASTTKPGAVRAGRKLLVRARAALDIPIVAIGGITPENGGDLIAAGADALAVASGVIAQADPEARARAYAGLFNNGRKRRTSSS
ncbi:MAG TPA: thiamine phosphate synthase [Alphaproteobacteria bacterium]|nr:thiamine phosphate synthase [Alphaproteobacteria bacterium]